MSALAYRAKIKDADETVVMLAQHGRHQRVRMR